MVHPHEQEFKKFKCFAIVKWNQFRQLLECVFNGIEIQIVYELEIIEWVKSVPLK
jgi:hypothetical protein